MPIAVPFRPLFALLFAVLLALPAQAEEKKEGALPPDVETALSTLLADAPQGKPDPGASTLDTLLRFVATNTKPAKSVRPESRPQGSGAYLKDTLNVPLRKLVAYMLDPSVPGEAIYPSAVRRNAWLPGSPLLKNASDLIDATFPPAAPLVTRGLEYEETTPDTSSGCYYSYKLNRLFVLTAYEGRTAFLSVSIMPLQSSVGLRGAIVGDDKDWTYVYTPEKGTNLAMLGWAETYLYGSASVSIFMESAPGGNKVDMYFFKWAKAGWKGSNVVKTSHITAGLKRFTSGLRQVMESPKLPPVKAIAAKASELKSLSEADLRARLNGFGSHLAKQNADPLDGKAFRAVLDNGAYPATLKREDAIAELMKLYMRQQMGTLPAAVAQQ